MTTATECGGESMWFIGLIVGGFIGAIGGGAGAVIGAMVGAGVGWALSQKLKAPSEERIATLETSIKLLQQRVVSLERSQRGTRRSETEPASEYAEPAPSASSVAPPIEPLAAQNESPSATIAPEMPVPPPPADFREPAFSPEPASPRSVLPRTPPEPSALWNFFFGGNTLVRFGVIVLFFGVAFLLRFASEHIEIPIEARLIGVAL